MKISSKLRYLAAVLMILLTVSSVTSLSKGTGTFTTQDLGFNIFLETR